MLHFYAAHAAADVLAVFRYGTAAFRFLFHPMPTAGGPPDLFRPGFGYDLWVVYAVWALIAVRLYPVCRWYARVKSRRPEWWWSYL